MNDQWPDLDWYTYYNIWERLSPQNKHVAEMVGVKEPFLARAMQNRINSGSEEQKKQLRIHRRFYAALILQDFCNEVSIKDVGRKYKIHKGLLQSLQNSSATFAGMVTVFCKKLGWSCLEVLLEQFQSRLSFGVCRDLCNLVRIPLLNRFTARLFYQNGFQTVSSIANATEKDITKLLRESTPFHSRKITDGGENMTNKAPQQRLWLNGKEGLSEREASLLIIDEARRILASDAQALGIPIDQLNISKKSPASDKRRKSRNCSGGRKRVSSDRITPWRKSKRPSPEQENTPRVMLAKLRSASRSRSKSISPLFREIQNVSTQKFFQDKNLSDSLFPDQPDNTTSRQPSQNSSFVDDVIPPNRMSTCSQVKTFVNTERHEQQIQGSWLNDDFPIFSPPMRGVFNDNIDTQDSLMLHENVPTQMMSPKGKPDIVFERKNETRSGLLESSDSLLFLSDSALEPRKNPEIERDTEPREDIVAVEDLEPKKTVESLSCCMSSDPDISLYLSTTEEKIEFVSDILPPLKLQSQFNAALTSTTSPDIELFGDNDIPKEENNSCDLFETTIELFSKEVASQTVSNESVNEFLVIDVTASKSLFQTFIQEWKTKTSFTISFSCETSKQSFSKGQSIGPRTGRALRSTKVQSCRSERLLYTHDDLSVTGVAVCWGKKDAYYIDLREEGIDQLNPLDDTALPPDVSNDLPLKLRINCIRSTINEFCNANVIGFNLKEQLKIIFELCDTLLPKACLQDPKVGFMSIYSNYFYMYASFCLFLIILGNYSIALLDNCTIKRVLLFRLHNGYWNLLNEKRIYSVLLNNG